MDSSLVGEVCVSDWEEILYVQLSQTILCKFEYKIQAWIEEYCCYLLVKLLIQLTQR